MDNISLNPSIVIQGILTFVIAFTCVDTLKEVQLLLKPSDPWKTIMMRGGILLALICLVLILFVLFPVKHNVV